jgi:hypothetical protein
VDIRSSLQRIVDCNYKCSATHCGVEFSWDDKKDRANRRKHGISFSLASLVFSDENRKEQLYESVLMKSAGSQLGWLMGKRSSLCIRYATA